MNGRENKFAEREQMDEITNELDQAWIRQCLDQILIESVGPYFGFGVRKTA